MHRTLEQTLLLLLPMVLLPAVAFAVTVPIGYVAWDVTIPGTTGEFDIVNETGPNSSGDATWPVTTSLHLSSLGLTVHFTDGTTSVLGSSYFTLSADGLSFDGGPISIGGANPKPTDATLTGSFSPTTITLFDASTLNVSPTFSASIPFRPGGLSDADLQIITATSAGTAVPEPGTWMLVATGIVGALLRGRHLLRHRHAEVKTTKEGSKAVYGIALVFACLILLPLSPSASWAAVKLNLWTAPDNGVAGESFVNLTGSGFPTAHGTITPGDVTISLSLTCGGSVIATTTASSVKLVIGSSYRIQFELPASLSTSQYFASISGMTSDGTPFSSTNCSEMIVTAAPSNGWTTLISRSWTLGAGIDVYRCRSIQLLTDMYITGFRAISPPGDYWTVLTVSDSAPNGVTGDYNCNAGTGTIGLKGLYAAGLGTNDLVFPPGVAVHLKAGQFVNMNLHVVNSTGTAVTELSGVQVQTASAADVTDEAEMFFAGTTNINVPSDGQTQFATGGCAAPQDYHAFALWPHMHGLGTRIELIKTHHGVSETLLDTPYALNAQLVDPLTPPVLVSQNDQLLVQCSYVNNSGSTVQFGDTSTQEQCFLGIYRYPVLPIDVPSFPSGTLFECVSS